MTHFYNFNDFIHFIQINLPNELILNKRKGFATNSSSSHSILEFEETIPNLKEHIISTIENSNSLKKSAEKESILNLTANVSRENLSYDDGIYFGWNFFTLIDKQTKLVYLASCVKDNFSMEYVEELFPKEIIPYVQKASIDHQSFIHIPTNFEGEIDKNFIKDLISYFSNDSVVIVGGNDNTSKEHSLTKHTNTIQSPISDLKSNFSKSKIVRKDDEFWTIFDKNNGTKTRFFLEPNNKPKNKAISPELADIKITDFCPYACNFCYQDSTLDGKHASLDNIKHIANELRKAQVFEVALGGGETTLHPNFVEILKIFSENKIVPNFTTKNLNLIKQSNFSEIIKYCGAMAFSVQSLEDMEKVVSAYLDLGELKDTYFDKYQLTDSKGYTPKITFQIILGVTPLSEISKMLELASHSANRITLLGYKENGRGSSFAPHDYSKWLPIVKKFKKNHYIDISIDTALAAESKSDLIANGVKENTFHITEGNFSVYIDAVKMKFAPSSYIGLEQTKSFDNNWLENYKSMSATPEYKKTIKIKNN